MLDLLGNLVTVALTSRCELSVQPVIKRSGEDRGE
jgi:hypothetical protein